MRRYRKNPPDWMGALDPRKKYTLSDSPITALYDTTSQLRPFQKPVGLWYACGLEWVEFLEDGLPDWLEGTNFVYEVVPNMNRIVQLRTVSDVYEFDDQFGENYKPDYAMYSDGVINWMKVSKVADGVEICPVQPSLRDDPKIEWYYNWDVASGCIWRPSGLTELVLVAQR